MTGNSIRSGSDIDRRLCFIGKIVPESGQVDYLCAGFFIDSQWVATAAHGIRECTIADLLVIWKQPGNRGPAWATTWIQNIVTEGIGDRHKSTSDLALIKTPTKNESESYSVSNLTKSDCEIVSLGWHENGKDLVSSFLPLDELQDAADRHILNQLSAYDSAIAEEFLIVSSIHPGDDLGLGNSGCPHFAVLGKNPAFLGITSVRFRETEESLSYYFLTPSVVIENMLSRIREGADTSELRVQGWDFSENDAQIITTQGGKSDHCFISSRSITPILAGETTKVRIGAHNRIDQNSKIHRAHLLLNAPRAPKFRTVEFEAPEDGKRLDPEVVIYTFPQREFLGRLTSDSPKIQVHQHKSLLISVDAVVKKEADLESNPFVVVSVRDPDKRD